MKFKQKPVFIEAMQWDGTNGDLIMEWGGGFRKIEYEIKLKPIEVPKPHRQRPGRILRIYTLEGVMEANLGDWIVKGISGELYPCKPDIFKASFEKVE